MALTTKLLTVNCPAGTGNQAYTGAGFTPQAIILFYSLQTADGNNPNIELGMGVATSPTARFAWGIQSQDNVATQAVRRAVSDAMCVRLVSNDGATTGIAADFVSFDADGFTLNWTIVTSGADIHVLCLGGLTNAKAHNFTLASGVTGSQAVTGVGFLPQSLLFLSTRDTAAAAAGADAAPGLSVTDGTSELELSLALNDNAATADGFYTWQSASILHLTNPAGTVEGESDIISFDSDGFTYTITNSYTSAYLSCALALRGLRVKVGSITVPGGTGAQATTGIGFQPSAILFFGGKNTFDINPRNAFAAFVGAATSSSARAVISTAHVDASDPMQADHDSDTTKVIKQLTAGTPTTDYAADLTSFDADGFTLNWASVTGSDNIGYMAFAAESTAGSKRGQAIFIGL